MTERHQHTELHQHSDRSSHSTPRPNFVDKLPYQVRIFLPGMMFALCFFFQNVCLHIATYYYVMWMHRLESDLAVNPTDVTSEDLSSRIETGALHDTVQDWLGRHDVSVVALDLLAAALPAVWLVLVFSKRDWRLWTKCCLCGCLLALGKGLLSILTVVPDSTGWEGCKARLRAADGSEGYKYFLEGGTGNSINFEVSILHSISDIMHLEIFGIVAGQGNRHLRYCADMIYSGHTYFAALFALGIYDFVHHHSRDEDPRTRFLLRFCIGLGLLGFVCTDVVCIILNRFHYTIDCVLAIWMVLLMYTNSGVTMATDLWVRSFHGDAYEHDFLLPPCCAPFCCLDGRYRLVPSVEEDNECSLLALWEQNASASSESDGTRD